MNEKETKKDIREPFFIVPSKVFELGLNPYELSVLFYLVMRADNKTHSCFPSANGIARGCNMSVRKVRDVLHSLKAKEIISIKPKYVSTRNNFNRQTSNHYAINIFDTHIAQDASHPCTLDTHPMYEVQAPPAQYAEEINKTIPNTTKNNITISTELSAEEAVEDEKKRFSFCELKKECFEILKNEKGFDDEKIALLERGLEYIWFKNGDSYEGKKYAQNELRELLCDKITPEILARSMEYLRVAGTDVRSPVPYLAKCILGGLVNGFPESALPIQSTQSTTPRENRSEVNSSFDINDFFSAALRNSYEDL